MNKLFYTALALFCLVSPVQADYQLQRSTTISDGLGGTYTGSTNGSVTSLQDGNGAITNTGTFDNFVLVQSNPLIKVSGSVTSVSNLTANSESQTVNGEVTLTVNTKMHVVVFDDMTVSETQSGPVYGGAVRVGGIQVPIIPGQIAENIIQSLLGLLD